MLLIVLLLILVSCSQNNDQDFIIQKPIDHPFDYFPLEVGTTWEYEITIGEGKALNYKEVIWPTDSGEPQMVAVRSFFVGQLNDETKTTFRLSYRIVDNHDLVGMYGHSDVRKIDVLIDELGVYEGHKELFWTVGPGRDFQITEVCTFDLGIVGASASVQDDWYNVDANASRFVFFGAAPGTAIMYSGSPESLMLLALENDILHFRHLVDSAYESNVDELSQNFQDDMWYEKDRGLIKLVQRVGGKITMTWELKNVYINFNPINCI